jgi:hypothetical protein
VQERGERDESTCFSWSESNFILSMSSSSRQLNINTSKIVDCSHASHTCPEPTPLFPTYMPWSMLPLAFICMPGPSRLQLIQ